MHNPTLVQVKVGALSSLDKFIPNLSAAARARALPMIEEACTEVPHPQPASSSGHKPTPRPEPKEMAKAGAGARARAGAGAEAKAKPSPTYIRGALWLHGGQALEPQGVLQGAFLLPQGTVRCL